MLRNTSMDLDAHTRKTGHMRSRSQSQHQVLALQENELPAEPVRPPPVTWMSLPRKGQLALLGLCRVFDFLQVASLQAYMFYQLKSFDENLSDSDVATQAGILQGAFTAAQFATAIPWGRVADAEWGGRRFVLLVGLVGTAVSCLGVAFSTSFAQAVFWRSFGGAINGTVGIIRTMIAENVKEKKYHSRAFLILPIGFNVASLFGPGEFSRIRSSPISAVLTMAQSWVACSPTRLRAIPDCLDRTRLLVARMVYSGWRSTPTPCPCWPTSFSCPVAHAWSDTVWRRLCFPARASLAWVHLP
jgi:MFS family permease